MKSIFHKFGASIVLSVSLLMTAPIVQASDDPIADAIKARQANFQLYSFYAGKLFGMAKGDIDYDATLAAAMADNLVAVANLQNGSMWLQGSDKASRPGDTRAKPEIWAEGSDVGDKFQALRDAALAVSMVAGNGLDALRGDIGAVGESCKGCHDEYRAKDF